MSRTTGPESWIRRQLPASRALAVSASRSGRGSSDQPQQDARADHQRRDRLDAVGRGSPRACGGNSATRGGESSASPAKGALVLSANRSGRGSSGQPQQGVRADEQGRDPLGACWKGPSRARGGTSATHTDEGCRSNERRHAVGAAGPTGDRCPNAGSRLRRCVRAAARTTDSPRRSRSGARTPSRRTPATVGRNSGCRPQRVSKETSEKYSVEYRVVASRRAGSRGIERITANRPQGEIGRWQSAADAVKAA